MDSEQLTLKLDDVEYPLVTLDDMTLGERREFERIAGDGVDKLAEMEERYRDGLMVAWMAVSIKRVKPEVPYSQIVDRLDELKQADLNEAWADLRGQSPPSTTPPGESSPESPPTIELGFDATSASDLQAGLQAAIGVLSSVSSGSAPTTSKS